MNSMTFKSSILAALILCSFSIAQAAPRYTVTDLGSLGSSSNGQSLNNRSHVAGYSWFLTNGSLCRHAFLWNPSDGLVDIGTLGGKSSVGVGINNKDQMTGFSYLSDQTECNPFIENALHAFIWTAEEGMIDLGTLGGKNSYGYGINDQGEVAGYSNLKDSMGSHAFLWTSKTGMTDLGTLGGSYSLGYAINKFGYVTGYSSTDGNGSWHAFVARSFRTSSRGKFHPGITMRDIGTLGGDMSTGQAINDLSQVTGYSNLVEGDTDTKHAFFWSERKKMVDLGTLGGRSSYGRGINNAGVVTGNSLISEPTEDKPEPESHGFLWSQANGMEDLNNLIPVDSGWVITSGNDINDDGHITAMGYKPFVGEHALLLSPIKPCKRRLPYVCK